MHFSVPKISNIDELSYLCCLEKTNRNNFLKTILASQTKYILLAHTENC